MKIELTIDDLEEYFADEYQTGKDIRDIFVERTIEEMVRQMIDDYGGKYNLDCHLRSVAKELVDNHKVEIIDKAVERITNSCMKTKKIKDEMPKKSEIKEIDKEWKEYFMGLIDECIKKKFK